MPTTKIQSGESSLSDRTLSNTEPTHMQAKIVKPIFIVGLPRTGSKLLMNIVNNNKIADYCVANEVQFYGHSFFGRILQGRKGVMPLVESERNGDGSVAWENVVDRMYSGEAHGVHWNGLTAGWLDIPKEKLLKNLSNCDGTPKGIYETILATQDREYSSYGDKSGPNLYFIETILDWFPDAKVIHIIRDPRAILTSQHKRLISVLNKKSSLPSVIKRVFSVVYSPIIALYIASYWGKAIRIDRRYSSERASNYMLVQYEKLIEEPESTTKEMCRFLSVPWDAGMLAPPKSDSSYIDPRDIQKAVNRGTGMDRDAMNRWRKHIKPWMEIFVKTYASIFYKKAIRELGYTD